jgi:hypothetical protein
LKNLKDCEGDFGFNDTYNSLTLKKRIVGAAVAVVDCDILKFVRWQPRSRREIINGKSAHLHASLTVARNSTIVIYFTVEK